jgi:RND superfamily putative drug exporter
MFFRFLGNTVTRTWPFWLVAWAALVLVTWWAAPAWRDVSEDREFSFLPETAPTRVADRAFQKAFPDELTHSSLVLVLERREPWAGSVTRDKQFIEDVLQPRLQEIADAEGGLASEPAAEPDTTGGAARSEERPRSIIARIRTPNAPGSGALLVSPSRQALLVVLELTTDFLSRRNWSTIDKVQDLLADLRQENQIPPGLEIYITGSAMAGRDHVWGERESAQVTELWTILLVVVLLVLIYRAPLAAAIPLATVFISVQIALHLLAMMAKAGWVSLFEGMEVYITVVAYGAGVDYCLFLMSRHKEELDGGADGPAALANAVAKVGGALTASAATVMFGIGMMVFAQFGKFRQAGIGMPLSLVLVLCATLTFATALLRLTGRWAFWPHFESRPCAEPKGSSWWAFWRDCWQRGFHRQWERLGQALLRWPGRIWLGTVALMLPLAIVAFALHDRLTYDLISDLPADSPSVLGTRALERHFPSGLVGPITALIVNPNVDFGTDEGRELIEQLTQRLDAQRAELALADLRSLTAPLGVSPAAKDAVAGIEVKKDVLEQELRKEALNRYTTDLGERAKTGARLDLILDQNPFSQRSLERFQQIQDAVRAALPRELANSQIYFTGATASIRDLGDVIDQDQVRIQWLVIGCVLLILFAVLRRLTVSIYLILSVLFSYYTTLGAAFVVFWALDPQGFAGIDWKVGIFLFTILIAVGEDYNIFLMTRIHEEQERHGPVRGVVEALIRTGPIISSCGLIMAGTFGSLMAGTLGEMKQLGFALAFGVLLDTFVVRPILVPAFLILFEEKAEQAAAMFPSILRRRTLRSQADQHAPSS